MSLFQAICVGVGIGILAVAAPLWMIISDMLDDRKKGSKK